MSAPEPADPTTGGDSVQGGPVPSESATAGSVPPDTVPDDTVPDDTVPDESLTGRSEDGRRAPVLFQVRPRKITIIASIAASVVVGVMILVSALLLSSEEGVPFRVADQIGLIGIGLLLGAGIMTAARPRLRVDRNGLWIRNVLAEQFTPWSLILRVGYPQGSPWAQLVMPDDEAKPVMAIQAMDRGRAVASLEKVRALQAQYGPPPPRPAQPAHRPEDDLARPLGRLEIIDRQKAAARDRDIEQRAGRRAAKNRDAGQTAAGPQGS